MDQNGRVYRRQRRPRQEHQQGQNPQNRKLVLVQFLPLLVLILFSVVPYLFQSVIKYAIIKLFNICIDSLLSIL